MFSLLKVDNLKATKHKQDEKGITDWQPRGCYLQELKFFFKVNLIINTIFSAKHKHQTKSKRLNDPSY